MEHVTDTVILVIQPASGDMLQFLKAGIIEVPEPEIAEGVGAVVYELRKDFPDAIFWTADLVKGTHKILIHAADELGNPVAADVTVTAP